MVSEGYRRAAGDSLGMDNVGMLYGIGLGVALNYQQAMVSYQKAAAGLLARSALAMDSIGVLYEHGWGVTKNLQEAMAWYQKSANAETPWRWAMSASTTLRAMASRSIPSRPSPGIPPAPRRAIL